MLLGSSYIYSKIAPHRLKVEYLLTELLNLRMSIME